jgi:hypothetical protein
MLEATLVWDMTVFVERRTAEESITTNSEKM